jgi:hypothetical protein
MQNRNFRGFGLFNIDFKSRNFPSGRCALAPIAIGSGNWYVQWKVGLSELLDFDTFIG